MITQGNGGAIVVGVVMLFLALLFSLMAVADMFVLIKVRISWMDSPAIISVLLKVHVFVLSEVEARQGGVGVGPFNNRKLMQEVN